MCLNRVVLRALLLCAPVLVCGSAIDHAVAEQADNGAARHARTLHDTAERRPTGPFARAVGPHRPQQRRPQMRLVQKPVVHTVSATTANLEWRTSLPAVCRVAWGPTPACENEMSFEVNYFASFSLTGLEPGETYYLRIESLGVPRGLSDKIDADPVQVQSEAVKFTTRQRDDAPRTLYVSPDGDNEHTGLSRDKAWRTLQHAASRARPGDTVRIAGGRYAERVHIRVTGAADAPITFASVPGEKPVLTGDGKKLGQIFVVSGKKHLRFDGLYFEQTSREPLQGWRLQLCGEFQLHRSADIQITRCFSDGRGGYSARFVSAWHARDVLIRNCVVMNKMSGSLMLWPAPNFRMTHSVIARPLTGSIVIRQDEGHAATLTHNIFTDMLRKKAVRNVPLFYGSTRSQLRMANNCYYLRQFPPKQRVLFSRDRTIDQLGAYIHDPVFADPRLAGDQSEDDAFGIDAMMNVHRRPELDFDDFFATNPAVTDRGIGLQRARFERFHFSQQPED